MGEMNIPPSVILELIGRFEQNHQVYHSEPFNETQLRREFLDPLRKKNARLSY
jgi:hypothetical protein